MNDFDKQFMSAEYKSGYEKGYAHGLSCAAVCLFLLGVCIAIFG